jgi:hypothetical protein
MNAILKRFKEEWKRGAVLFVIIVGWLLLFGMGCSNNLLVLAEERLAEADEYFELDDMRWAIRRANDALLNIHLHNNRNAKAELKDQMAYYPHQIVDMERLLLRTYRRIAEALHKMNKFDGTVGVYEFMLRRCTLSRVFKTEAATLAAEIIPIVAEIYQIDVSGEEQGAAYERELEKINAYIESEEFAKDQQAEQEFYDKSIAIQEKHIEEETSIILQLAQAQEMVEEWNWGYEIAITQVRALSDPNKPFVVDQITGVACCPCKAGQYEEIEMETGDEFEDLEGFEEFDPSEMEEQTPPAEAIESDTNGDESSDEPVES